jgi:hypothetical protein
MTYEEAYHNERRARIKSEQAYASLYAHYRRTIGDLYDMTKKYLHFDPEMGSTHEPAIVRQRLNSEGNHLPSTYEDYEISQSDWDMLERDIERELDGKNEEFDMMRGHRSALGNAMNGIYEVEQEMREASPRLALPSASDYDKKNSLKQAGSTGRGLKRKLGEI